MKKLLYIITLVSFVSAAALSAKVLQSTADPGYASETSQSKPPMSGTSATTTSSKKSKPMKRSWLETAAEMVN